LEPSHVLMALGVPLSAAHSSLRLSLDEENTQEEIDYTIGKVAQIIERLRAMSPIA